VALIALAAAHHAAEVSITGGGSGTLAGLSNQNDQLLLGVKVGGAIEWKKSTDLRLNEHRY
jgi:hypothetical protein